MILTVPNQTFSWWVRRLDTADALGAIAELGTLLPVPEDTPYQIHYLGDPWWIVAQGPSGEADSGLPEWLLRNINYWYTRELHSHGEKAAYHYFRYALLNLRHCGATAEHLDKSAAKNYKIYLLTLSSLPLGTLYPVRPIRRRGGEEPPAVENTSPTTAK